MYKTKYVVLLLDHESIKEDNPLPFLNALVLCQQLLTAQQLYPDTQDNQTCLIALFGRLVYVFYFCRTRCVF